MRRGLGRPFLTNCIRLECDLLYLLLFFCSEPMHNQFNFITLMKFGQNLMRFTQISHKVWRGFHDVSWFKHGGVQSESARCKQNHTILRSKHNHVLQTELSLEFLGHFANWALYNYVSNTGLAARHFCPMLTKWLQIIHKSRENGKFSVRWQQVKRGQRTRLEHTYGRQTPHLFHLY